MSNLFIDTIGQNQFIINNIECIQGRPAIKLNIFLNGFRDYIREQRTTAVEFDFKNEPDLIVGKALTSIVGFIERLGYCVELSSSMTAIFNRFHSHQNDFVATKKKLESVATKNISEDIEFQKFCSFCDNTLSIKLRPYQYKAAYLLSMGKGGFDFSVPGAGKTIITYAAYSYLKSRQHIDKLFVIGPISSYNAWFEEFITCFGVEPEFENLSTTSTSDCKAYLTASITNHKNVTFINGDKIRLLTSEIKYYLKNDNILLVIDEAHKIKNPNASITKGVIDISQFAKSRILLTGTPLPNGYEDLWSLMTTFSPFDKILPYNYNQLKSFTKTGIAKKQEDRLRSLIKPYYSRISKKFLLQTKELLPVFEHTIYVDMDDEQLILYEKLNAFCGKIKEEIDEDFLAALKKAVLIRKMQISANPALLLKGLMSSMDELMEEYADSYYKDDGEIENLVLADNKIKKELLSSGIMRIVQRYAHENITTRKNIQAVKLVQSLVSQGKKVLVWEIFVDNMITLQHLIETTTNISVEIVNGTVTGEERQNAISRFRNGKSMVLIANPATLAESISLHKVCQNAIYVNRNFNAAQFIQSKDRIHRINMPSGTTATYYFLMNTNTVDDIVGEKLALKEQRMLAILDADDIEVGGAEFEDGCIMSKKDIEDSFDK